MMDCKDNSEEIKVRSYNRPSFAFLLVIYIPTSLPTLPDPGSTCCLSPHIACYTFDIGTKVQCKMWDNMGDIYQPSFTDTKRREELSNYEQFCASI